MWVWFPCGGVCCWCVVYWLSVSGCVCSSGLLPPTPASLCEEGCALLTFCVPFFYLFICFKLVPLLQSQDAYTCCFLNSLWVTIMLLSLPNGLLMEHGRPLFILNGTVWVVFFRITKEMLTGPSVLHYHRQIINSRTHKHNNTLSSLVLDTSPTVGFSFSLRHPNVKAPVYQLFVTWDAHILSENTTDVNTLTCEWGHGPVTLMNSVTHECPMKLSCSSFCCSQTKDTSFQ